MDVKRGILLLLLLLSLTACSQKRYGTGFENDRFYKGYNGVDAQITAQLPPSRMYYYGTGQDNSFDVNVEVQNKGAAWSRGAIFVSGYDPNMIQIDGIHPDPTQARACRLSIGNIGLGTFGGTFICDNLQLGVGENGFVDFGFDSDKLFGGSGLNYRHNTDGTERWDIDFSNPDIDVEYANHGRLLISVLSGLNFERLYGVEYLLAGNTYEFPGGETAYVNFNGNIVNWPPGLDQTEQTFLITNCYLYATYAAPVVCIDPAPMSENKKVCTPKAYTGTSGQGAPVAVTYIEQENTPRQAIFTIHIKNQGGGRVYDPGMLEICSPYSPARVTTQELNVVYIGDIRVSGDLQRLDCSPNNFVRLDPRTGEGIVTCKYDIPFSGLRSAYQTPLVVELWYGYENTVQKRVTIKRAI